MYAAVNQNPKIFTDLTGHFAVFSRNLMDRRTLLARKDRSDNYRMSEISKMKSYRCNDASKGKRRDPGNEVGKNLFGRIMWYNKRHGNEFLGTCDHHSIKGYRSASTLTVE